MQNAIAEFKKHFPDAPHSEVEEFKCWLNERTTRGSLFVTPEGLYFFSQMLGIVKTIIPFDNVLLISKEMIQLDAAIVVTCTTGIYKFSGFLMGTADRAEASIKKLCKRSDIPSKDKVEPPQLETQSLAESITKKTTFPEFPKSEKAVDKPKVNVTKELKDAQKGDETSVVEKSSVKKETAKPTTEISTESKLTQRVPTQSKTQGSSSNVHLAVRQRQQEAEAAWTASEQKRKELSRSLHQPPGSHSDSAKHQMEKLLLFAKKFLVSFFALWLCSFVMTGLVIDGFCLHVVISTLFASIDIAIGTRSIAKLLAARVMPYVKDPKPKQQRVIALGFLCLIHLVLGWIFAFLLDGVEIGFFPGLVGVVVLNVTEFITLVVV